MTTQKKHCLLSICLIFMVIQSVSVAEVTKAWLDVNDIFAVWQNAYCNFEIPKISYIYDGQQRTTLQEILSSESGIKVSICNTDGLSCAEYASDGNQTSIYFSNSKSATITKFERDPMFYGKYGSSVIPAINFLQEFMLSDRTPPKWIPRLVTFMQDKNLRSNMRVLPALETVLDTPCHVLQIDPNMNKRFKLKTKIWFASDKSMLALRFLCTDPNGKVFEEISTQKIASVETKNGVIWYPVLAKRYKSFPMTSRIESTKIEVKALESKVTFDKSVFKSTFPRGTRVIDRIHSVVYVTGMDDVDQVGAIQQLKK